MYAVFGAARSICAPLWTVSIEEQFYLIWPVVMRKLKHSEMAMAAVATFLLAIASQVGLVLVGASTSFMYFGSAPRCDTLALGILLALYRDRLPRLTASLRFLLVAGGLIGCVISARLINRTGPMDIYTVLGRLIISLASVAILYACLYSRTKLVTGAWVVRLGKVSYGLYMLHFTGLLIALSLLRPLHGGPSLATKALGFCFTVLLSFASYRWIESPFLRLKGRVPHGLS